MDMINNSQAMISLPWEKLYGCNVLVTGATGLIGSCIINILFENIGNSSRVYAAGRNELRARKLFSRFWNKDNFIFLKYDVNYPLDSNVQFDYIIHAASNASPYFFAEDPVGVMMSNLLGTKNLLDYGKKHGIKRFLYVSSGEVYGNGNVDRWKEDDCGYVNSMTIRSCYPTSKRAAETLCIAYSQEYDIDVVVARPCHTYGAMFTEKDNRVFAQFVRNILANKNIVLKSKGEQFRSWIYVKDCAYAILTILLKGKNCEAYNVADENSCVTIKDLAHIFACLGNVDVIFELPTDNEKKGFSVMKKNIFDTSKLEELGWKPNYNLQLGLKETIELAKLYNNQV